MVAEESGDDDREIDRIADEFEAAWKTGVAPELGPFLSRVPAELRQALLEELVSVDISCRRMRGQTKPMEAYIAEFPELADSQGGVSEHLRAFHSYPGVSSDPTPTGGVSAEADEVPLPKSIGNYNILRRLGGGSFGVVLLGEQQRPRRYVALKVLRAAVMDGRQLQRFEQEAEALGRLEHANIAHVFEAGIDESGVFPQPFLAMEYVDGLPLHGFVRNKSLDRPGIVRLMILVATAVQYAHQRGIIHRDLKPGNILVTREGQPKLLDFGLAKFVKIDSATQLASLTGEVVGTPEYMAPEQARGEVDRIDTRTDIYSLGAILYYLVLNCHAHAMDGSVYRRLERVGREEPRRPRNVDPHLDADLEAILVKTMAREPERRYASAAELAADMQRYLDGDPLVARGQTTLYFLRNRLWRHRRAVASIVAGLVLLIGAGIFYVHTLQVQRQEARTARAKAERQQQLAEASLLHANEQRAVALQTLNDLVFNAQRELRTTPGAIGLRRKLLDIALTGLDRIAQIAGDAQLRPDRTTAAAILQIGDLLQSLGQHAEAETAYQRAVDMFSELAKSDPARRGERDLMVALTRLGWQRLQTYGDPSAARPILERASSLCAQLSSGTAEGDEQSKRDRWTTLLACADLKVEMGDRNALEEYRKAESLVPDGGSDHALTLRKWGAAMLRLSKSDADATEATVLLRRAVQADRGLLAAQGGRGTASSELSASLSHLASSLARAKELTEARTVIEESIQLAQSAATDAPENLGLQIALAGVNVVAGDILLGLTEKTAAASHYASAVRILEELSAHHRLSPRNRQMLQTARSRLAELGGAPTPTTAASPGSRHD